MAYDDAYHVTRAACIDAYASKSAAGKRAAKANADTKATAYFVIILVITSPVWAPFYFLWRAIFVKEPTLALTD